MKKICFVVATPLTAKSFLAEHIAALSQKYEVFLLANFKDNNIPLDILPNVNAIDVAISRDISLFKDVKALFVLLGLFRHYDFEAVHSVTPKAGLLSMMAAALAGVKNRFHTFTGQVWVNKNGIFKLLLKSLDKVTFACSTYVLVDSPSQRDFLIAEGVITAAVSECLADGSISGVNLYRFKPDTEKRVTIRALHSLPEDSFIFLFLGRLSNEKGIPELISAFSGLDYIGANAYLMLVGPEEDGVIGQHNSALHNLGDHFVRQGFTSTPEAYMAAADVFCLPSHREGFGTVILEAAAAGIPTIGSNIYGISDAIEDGVSGLLHIVRDASDLQEKMQKLVSDRAFASKLGQNALDRASHKFSSDLIVRELVCFYEARV